MEKLGIKCPKCGGDIMITPKAYGCANWRDEDGGCKFTVWKECSGHAWSEDEAKRLISGETLKGVAFVSRKTGKPFTADAKIDPETGRIKFEFPKRN